MLKSVMISLEYYSLIAGLSGIAICSSDQKFSLFLYTLELAHEFEACLIRAITDTNLKVDSFSDINLRNTIFIY